MNEKEKAICTLQNDIAEKQEQIRFIEKLDETDL